MVLLTLKQIDVWKEMQKIVKLYKVKDLNTSLSEGMEGEGLECIDYLY
jgi:hypothetical protein